MSSTAHLVQMFDSTIVRAHVSAAGAKGGQAHQALGCSRGGFSTKIHLKSDFEGGPLAFCLTSGEASDSPQFPILLDLGPDVTPRAALADKGYDAKANRSLARERGIAPAIPHKANAKSPPAFFPQALYRGRARLRILSGPYPLSRVMPQLVILPEDTSGYTVGVAPLIYRYGAGRGSAFNDYLSQLACVLRL